MTTSNYLPVEGAAKHIGISVSTMNKARCTGGGPQYLKIGRRVVYDIRDLEQFMSATRRRSTSDSLREAA
jgi:hypothetical protein